MLPSIEAWLSASWADFRRRWGTLMIVTALTGLGTVAGVLLPLLPAGGVSFFISGWAAWAIAGTVSLLAGLWLSTWGQAALVLAASGDVRPGDAMREGWVKTGPFAWVLSLVLLAAGGGFCLLVIPGLLIGAMLFFAPFYQMSGEEEGMAALELSCARAKAFMGDVCARLALAALIVWIPAWIPYVGWLIAPLWAPFGLVACARLAADLKAAVPAPERTPMLVPVAALSAVFVAASFAMTWAAARGAMAAYRAVSSGELSLKLPDEATGRSLIAVLQGQGSEEDQRRSMEYVLSISSTVPVAP